MIIHMTDHLARKCARLQAAGHYWEYLKAERRMLTLQIRGVLYEWRLQFVLMDCI